MCYRSIDVDDCSKNKFLLRELYCSPKSDFHAPLAGEINIPRQIGFARIAVDDFMQICLLLAPAAL